MHVLRNSYIVEKEVMLLVGDIWKVSQLNLHCRFR